jgi:hypothetical protein
VAEALLCLADSGAPIGLLSASGVVTAARIERLIEPSRNRFLSTLTDGLLVMGIMMLALSPLALAVAGHVLLCRL